MPGYPHTARPLRALGAARDKGPSKPTKLLPMARVAAAAFRRRCLSHSGAALFIGDSITRGTSMRRPWERLQYPAQQPLPWKRRGAAAGANETGYYNPLAVYYRVATSALEDAQGKGVGTLRKQGQEGAWWWRRTYTVGDAGVTAEDVARPEGEHADDVRRFVRGEAGRLDFVCYFMGANDLISGRAASSNASAWEASARATLSVVRRAFHGPCVVASVPFGVSPAIPSMAWHTRAVWWSWEIGRAGDAARRLAADFRCGLADFRAVLDGLVGRAPTADGLHPFTWAHRPMARELLRAAADATAAVRPGPACGG